MSEDVRNPLNSFLRDSLLRILSHNSKNGEKLRLVEGKGGKIYLLDESREVVSEVLTKPTDLTVNDLDLMIPLDLDHQAS